MYRFYKVLPLFVFVVLAVRADDGPVEKPAQTPPPGAPVTRTESGGSSSPGMMSWISIYEQIVNPNSQTAIREAPAGNVMTAPAPQPVGPAPAMMPAIEEPVRNPNAPIDARTYVIQVGDKLGYRIVEDHDDAKLLSVSLSGEMEVPFLGRVNVAGKRLNDAAKEISSMLEKEMYKQATVVLSVEEMNTPKAAPSSSTQYVQQGPPVRPKKVTIVGQVRNPGMQEYPLDGKLTLTEAILKAGGFASFANGKKVKVIRRKSDGTGETIFADVMAVLKDGKLEADLDLKPDDLIIVPEKFLNF